MPKQKFYAVAAGRTPGAIFDTWDECQPNVTHFSGSVHKSFSTREEAASFLASHGVAEQGAGAGPSNYDADVEWTDHEPSFGQVASARTATSGLLEVRPAAGAKRRGTPSVEPTYFAHGGYSTTTADDRQTRDCDAEPLSAVGDRVSRGAGPVIDADRTYRLEFDGASRRNPGPAGAGAVIFDEAGLQVGSVSQFLGRATNNEAEYAALIKGLQAAEALGVRRLRVTGDSKLVIEQVMGRWRCDKPHLQPLQQQASSLKTGFASCTLEHVLRHHNATADELSNIAIDTRGWDGVKLPDGSLLPLNDGHPAKRARTAEPGGTTAGVPRKQSVACGRVAASLEEAAAVSRLGHMVPAIVDSQAQSLSLLSRLQLRSDGLYT